MAKKPNPKPDDKAQSRRFVEDAKTLEVDESGKKFERAFTKIASQNITSPPASTPARTKRRP